MFLGYSHGSNHTIHPVLQTFYNFPHLHLQLHVKLMDLTLTLDPLPRGCGVLISLPLYASQRSHIALCDEDNPLT